MSKTREHPIATKHDEITHVLEQAGEEDIEIIHLSDEMVIHIKTALTLSGIDPPLLAQTDPLIFPPSTHACF